jgi:hypothetical protein
MDCSTDALVMLSPGHAPSYSYANPVLIMLCFHGAANYEALNVATIYLYVNHD